MNRPKRSEIGIVAVGMVGCCILTEVVLAGVVTVAVASIGGAAGLAAIAGLLLGALMFVRRRNAIRCCALPRSQVPTQPMDEVQT